MVESIPTPEDFLGNPEPAIWAEVERYAKGSNDEYAAALLSLRARVEALEGRYETQRLATLEWGKDVDMVKRWCDRHLQRIEALEANVKPTSNLPQTRPSDITPPPELVQQWSEEAAHRQYSVRETEDYLIEQAAQYGADTELEACCERQALLYGNRTANELRAARRPKPPSLKQEALALIDECDYLDDNALSTIRRALEQLDD